MPYRLFQRIMTSDRPRRISSLWKSGNEADSRSSSTASTPKSVRIATPYRKMSADDSGSWVITETPEKSSGYCSRDTNYNNAAPDRMSPRDGNKTTAWINVSGFLGGEMWRRILAINGFVLLSLVGVMFLVIDMMTASQRVALIGQECFSVIHVAAPYMLSLPYLTLVGSGATMCGICGAAGLLGTNQVSQMIGGVTLTLLWIYASLNCVIELIIGIHGTTRGKMYDEYLATFKTLHQRGHASAPNALDFTLAGKLSLLEDFAHIADADYYARAIEATSLHFWLCLWFSLASTLIWAIGDAYSKILFGVGERKRIIFGAIRRRSFSEFDQEVGITSSASKSRPTSRPTSLTSTTTTATNSAHYKINTGFVLSKI